MSQSTFGILDSVISAGASSVYTAAVCRVDRRGQTVFERAYGWLDPETQTRPAQVSSLFDLASVTKMFTVTALMTLVEAGKVTLDQPVAAIVPEFSGVRPIGSFEHPLTGEIQPNPYPGVRVDVGRVTFRQLLTHTSGLPDWLPLYRLPNQEAAIQAVLTTDFAYPTATRLVYSDLGLIVLAEAIQRLAGVPLEEFLHASVLEPLGACDTAFHPAPDETTARRGEVPEPRLARCAPTEVCQWRKRRLVGEVHDENTGRLGGVSGHAGLFSTVSDVAALGQLYLNGGEYHGRRLLLPATVAETTRIQVDIEGDRRGLGWMLEGTGEWRRSGLSDRAYGHTGFTGVSLWVEPDAGLVVVLLTNRVYFGRDFAGIRALRQNMYGVIGAADLGRP